MPGWLRTWRNADRFKPNVTPPRQKFAGFVEFVFNPSVVSNLGDSSAFRTQISSLVQTAKIPEIQFTTTKKNQYNYKRLVQTGVEYGPCDITVIDTVNNEWLTLFMKYFAYYRNEPRNRTNPASNDSRDNTPTQWPSNREVTVNPSTFQTAGFQSNGAGLDVSGDSHFFDHIKIVNYAGGRGVEYILFRPVITSFVPGDIDYTSSDFRTFDITFEVENVTVNSTMNFKLDEVDLLRFDNSDIDFSFDDNDKDTKDNSAHRTVSAEYLGSPSDPRKRTGQPK